jgi:hypothetical protein
MPRPPCNLELSGICFLLSCPIRAQSIRASLLNSLLLPSSFVVIQDFTWSLVRTKLGGMMDSQGLLVEVIAASNRTTRAVRAFVRFLFIQLTATTAAVFIWNLGSQFQDPSQCFAGVCEPNGPALFLAVIVWIVGVIWSSIAGWTELSYSDIPSLPIASRPKTEVAPETEARASKIVPSRVKAFRPCPHCGAELPRIAVACVVCNNRV